MPTTLNHPIHEAVRLGVVAAYADPFNEGKPIDIFLVESIVHSVSERLVRMAEDDPALKARSEAFYAIQTERMYQNAGFGNAADRVTGEEAPRPPMTPGEHILTADNLLRYAKDSWYIPGTQVNVAHIMRKIAAVAVSYMEHYGALPRQFTDQQAILLHKD